MESVNEDDAIVDEQRKEGKSEKKRKKSEEIHWGNWKKYQNPMKRENSENIGGSSSGVRSWTSNYEEFESLFIERNGWGLSYLFIYI